jgi:hypothetical protein
MSDASGVKPALGTVPKAIEDHGTVYILLNLSKTEHTVSLPSSMNDVGTLRTKSCVRRTLLSAAFDVAFAYSRIRSCFGSHTTTSTKAENQLQTAADKSVRPTPPLLSSPRTN